MFWTNDTKVKNSSHAQHSIQIPRVQENINTVLKIYSICSSGPWDK